MFKSPGLDAAGLYEVIDLFGLEANDPPEPIGGDLTLVDEAIESPGRYAEALGGPGGAKPSDLIFGHEENDTTSLSIFRYLQ